MISSVVKTGRISSISIIVLTILFLFLIIFIPPQKFVSVDEYMMDFSIRKIIPVIPSLLLVIANIILFISLFYYAENGKKIFAHAGLIFGSVYAVCCGINYFAQLSLIPVAVQNQNSQLLSVFLMDNPASFAYSLDNLGYFFLALSFIFFAGIFNHGKLHSWIKSVFIVYGISAFAGTMGYLLNIPFLETMVLISALPYLVGIVLLYIEFGKLKTIII